MVHAQTQVEKQTLGFEEKSREWEAGSGKNYGRRGRLERESRYKIRFLPYWELKKLRIQ